MPVKDDTLNASAIAELFGCDRSQISRWRKEGKLTELGEPVNPGERSPRWPRERVLALGKARGYLDARGRRVPRDKTTRTPPVPVAQVPAGERVVHYFVPDVAAMFHTDEQQVHMWVHRGKLRRDEAVTVGRHPAWPMRRLRELAKAVNRTLDEDAKRP